MNVLIIYASATNLQDNHQTCLVGLVVEPLGGSQNPRFGPSYRFLCEVLPVCVGSLSALRFPVQKHVS